MKVTLNHYTPLVVCSDAIRTCWQSGDKSDTKEARDIYATECIMEGDFEFRTDHITGEKDRTLIDRVGNKNKHASTLEHLTYSFYIDGISRALLQELARHRMASLSVKSTRYTLKELKYENPFIVGDLESMNQAQKYVKFTGEKTVDMASVKALEELRIILESGVSNDIAKYCLPESYKTSLTWTINARSLQNFLFLRSDKAALWEIRDLAHALYDSLPLDHQYLFEAHIKEGV